MRGEIRCQSTSVANQILGPPLARHCCDTSTPLNRYSSDKEKQCRVKVERFYSTKIIHPAPQYYKLHLKWKTTSTSENALKMLFPLLHLICSGTDEGTGSMQQ